MRKNSSIGPQLAPIRNKNTMTNKQVKLLSNLQKPRSSQVIDPIKNLDVINNKRPPLTKKTTKMDFDSLITNYSIEDKAMQKIEKDITNLNKIKKQKQFLDKRSSLLYDGQGVFPSNKNYQKFINMGDDDYQAEIQQKKRIKEVKFDNDVIIMSL